MAARNDARSASGIASSEYLEPRHLMAAYLPTAPLQVGPFLYDAAVGDFNRDGKADLAITPGYSNDARIALNSGKADFSRLSSISAGAGPFSVTTADVNGDRKLDVITANESGKSVSVLLGNGKGGFLKKVDYPMALATTSAPYAVVAADLNADGKIDLAVTDPGNHGVQIFYNSGTGKFLAPRLFKAPKVSGRSVSPETLRLADLNHDKRPDLIFSETAQSRVGLLMNSGGGAFIAITGPTVGKSPYDIGVGDFNGDGKIDLVTVNHGANSLSILSGNGNGTFKPAISIATIGTPTAIRVADMNGDHRPDLLISSGDTGTIRMVYGTNRNSFKSAATFSYDGGVARAIADFNADHKLDILVCSVSDGTMRVLLAS